MKLLYIFLFHTRLVQSVRFTEGRHVPHSQKKQICIVFLQCMCSSNSKNVGQKQIMPVTVKERASRLRQTDIFPMNTGV